MLIQADSLQPFPLADGSVQMCVTSPPYWGLRDYGIDGQLGLEATPDEFVAHMVAVFREVWRVLRDDGIVFLNLGDSYASTSKGTGGHSEKQDTNTGSWFDGRRVNGVPRGLKQKDLVGIPWMVAKALQQPFYTGRITSEADRIWLAAIIDGEGCMFIHKRKAGQSNGQGYARKSDTFGAGLEVANTHLSIIERCQQITGQGSITRQEKESKHGNYRNLPLYRWHMRSNECRKIIQEVYPYLTAKKHEARLLLGCPSSGEQADRAHVGLIGLHNGREADIDFPEPASLYVPGWYLRSDIIWSKLNPMPESVTDRPTKSHEYLFLMSKQPRYYYDAEAVKEDAAETNIGAPFTAGIQRKQEAMGRDMSMGTLGTNYGNGTRNRRSVWTIPTAPYSGAHFATFPPALVEPCILAGTSAHGACSVCGAPWARVTERELVNTEGWGKATKDHTGNLQGSNAILRNGKGRAGDSISTTTGWSPTCIHADAPTVPCIVLDPFAGSGTTGAVARLHGRRFVGLDLNGKYLRELALPRAEGKTSAAALAELPLFAV